MYNVPVKKEGFQTLHVLMNYMYVIFWILVKWNWCNALTHSTERDDQDTEVAVLSLTFVK